MSTFFGLNISRLGMQAQQTALHVTAHNIANANTPGYSRQVARMAATLPQPFANKGMLGTGVVVEEIARVRDDLLDFQIRKEFQTLGKWESRHSVLTQVEYVFMEPSETGFNSVLSRFFDGWQEVSLNPEGTPVRAALIQNGATMVNSVRHINEQLKSIRSDIDYQIELKVKEVNNLAEQIKDLNYQIVSLTVMGEAPGDLMDRRDLLIDRLAELIEFTAVPTNTGSINIFMGGRELVAEGRSSKLTVVPGENEGGWPLAPKVVWERDGREVRISNGELAGLIQVRDTHLRGYMEDFESMVWGIVNAVNNTHQGGMDLLGEAGVVFFTGTSLEELAVNQDLISDPRRIAAAALPDPHAGTANPGDGSNAVRLAQLRHSGISIDLTADLKNRVTLNPGAATTFESYYRDNISRLGVHTQESKRMAQNQQSLLELMTRRKDSISGVSLDEELANMVQFQMSYQASARVIATLTEIYDTILRLV
jgi:flagellar hook-associated protein 1